MRIVERSELDSEAALAAFFIFSYYSLAVT